MTSTDEEDNACENPEGAKMRQLTHSETFMVNGDLNFLWLIQGQRPMVYTFME